jgi:hypothetical protein
LYHFTFRHIEIGKAPVYFGAQLHVLVGYHGTAGFHGVIDHRRAGHQYIYDDRRGGFGLDGIGLAFAGTK